MLSGATGAQGWTRFLYTQCMLMMSSALNEMYDSGMLAPSSWLSGAWEPLLCQPYKQLTSLLIISISGVIEFTLVNPTQSSGLFNLARMFWLGRMILSRRGHCLFMSFQTCPKLTFCLSDVLLITVIERVDWYIRPSIRPWNANYIVHIVHIRKFLWFPEAYMAATYTQFAG